jgi:uncharacterized protein
LEAKHLHLLVKMSPKVLLLGVGEKSQILPQDLLDPFINAGIGVEVMTTGAACRTYNVLMAEGRNVVAALII